MGVYIKGLKMPKSCWMCHLCNDEYGVCNVLNRNIKKDTGRFADCPLLPVPDHGDLIDRDALIEEAKILGTVTCHQPFDFPYGCNLVEWCKLAKAVIPAERSEDGETKQISAEFAKLMREGEIKVRWRDGET